MSTVLAASWRTPNLSLKPVLLWGESIWVWQLWWIWPGSWSIYTASPITTQSTYGTCLNCTVGKPESNRDAQQYPPVEGGSSRHRPRPRPHTLYATAHMPPLCSSYAIYHTPSGEVTLRQMNAIESNPNQINTCSQASHAMHTTQQKGWWEWKEIESEYGRPRSGKTHRTKRPHPYPSIAHGCRAHAARKNGKAHTPPPPKLRCRAAAHTVICVDGRACD